ncbi:MAG: hypothetical protein Q9180_009037 [Flavoplaca navasiana]
MTPLSSGSEDWSFLLNNEPFEQGSGPSVSAEVDTTLASDPLWSTLFEPALILDSGTAQGINNPQLSAVTVEGQRPGLYAQVDNTLFEAPDIQNNSFSHRKTDRCWRFPAASAKHKSMRAGSGPACNCLSRILETTQAIHRRLGHASIPLDAILKGNRDAIFLIRSAFACPGTCAKRNVSFYSIACGCLDMVLTSYETALRASVAPSSSATTNSSPFPEPTSVPAGAYVTACQPPVELKFGDFSIGSQDQDFFVRKIFACEISRIEEILTPGMASTEAWGGEDFMGIFEDLRSYLVQKLKLVIEDCAMASKT